MGGKAFEGIVPLPNTKLHVLNKVIPFIKDFECSVVGSGRIGKPEYNDIDYCVEASDVAFTGIHNAVIDADFETRTITPHCFSIKIPDGAVAYQIDIMQSRNLTYSRQVYHASNNSKYKGVYRNILLMALIKVLSVREFLVGNNGIIRTRQHLDLYDGLVYMVQYKNVGTQRFKTLDKQTISLDFVKAIRDFLPNIESHQFDSFEGVVQAIERNFYRDQGNVSLTIEIFTEAKEIMQSHNLDVPNEILVWA